MSDADALLAAIRAAPDDDGPRLVYADWLDEHGQPERAEFIRVQCQLARGESTELRSREAELLSDYHDVLAESLAALHLRFRFERGFIVAFGHTGVFTQLESEEDARSSISHSYFLRFYPNGEACGTGFTGFRHALPDDWSKPPDWLHRGDRMVESGTYVISPLESPCGLVFTTSQGEFAGTLEGTRLSLTFHSRFLDKYTSLKRFTHVEVPGFDSFPET